MKKVLFATTALVMTAGVAAAEVAVGGDGRMGVVYNGDSFDFTSRMRVNFTASGETDGGLSFGGSMRLDHENGVSAGEGRASAGGAGSVYISGAFGKITMGDIDGAAESAVGDLPGVGLTGLGDLNEFGYTGAGLTMNGNPGLLYSYSFDNGNVYLSMYDGAIDLNSNGVIDPAGSGESAQIISIGGNYTFGNFTVAAGYETVDYDTIAADTDTIVVAAIGTFGDVKVTAAYATSDDVPLLGDFDQYGIGAEASFGATTVTGFYRAVDSSLLGDEDYFGIGASYDLGGGASIKGGIVDNDVDTVADFGISFSF